MAGTRGTSDLRIARIAKSISLSHASLRSLTAIVVGYADNSRCVGHLKEKWNMHFAELLCYSYTTVGNIAQRKLDATTPLTTPRPVTAILPLRPLPDCTGEAGLWEQSNSLMSWTKPDCTLGARAHSA